MDIKKVIPIPDYNPEEDVLSYIYGRQLSIVNRYIEMGKIPFNYPLNLESRDEQQFMRELLGYLIEELSEAYEIYCKMVTLQYQQQGDTVKTKEYLVDMLYKYNEELADILHFSLEIMLYSNINPDDINVYYRTLLQELGLDESYYFDGNTLSTILQYARHCNIQRRIYSDKQFRLSYCIIKKDELKDDFICGGRYLSPVLQTENAIQLWDITHQYSLARNMLKKKPWRSSGIEVDYAKFQEQIMEGFLNLMRYMDLVGMTEDSILTVYTRKNLLLINRLNSGY